MRVGRPAGAESRTAPAKERNPGLELFFDLVFVLCVAQLADLLHEDPTWTTALTVLLLFVPVWWTWTGVTFALNRFPTDDNSTTLALLLAAAASGAMALAIPDVPGAGNDWFAVGYASVRFILAAMYWRARTRDRRLTVVYGTGFTVTGAVWFISIALPHDVQPYVWAAAVVVDILIPALADRAQRMLPVDEHHLPDRFSAFAIIVLGEAAVNTVGVAREPLQSSTVVVLAEGFVLAALLWWGFFDRTAYRFRYRQLTDRDRSGRVAYVVCAYLHFPLVVGVAVVGAGVQVATEEPAGVIPASSAVMVTCGIAAYLLTLNAMTRVLHTPKQNSLIWPRFAMVVLLGLWLWLGRGQSTTTFLAGCAVVLLLHVLGHIRRGRQMEHRTPTTAG